eukprot:TRINITY_DN2561_c0_g1_i1.p1 TRINITY_DN2561_c0_g1~~TRINITY_DN2561_c0_g1_i1.p1  ORF type:complete len:219 (+),score=49.09 TRINITY_DN2561_c0_g1_i1:102-758(+)
MNCGGPEGLAVHYRVRCDGAAIFSWRWIFDIPEPKHFFVNQTLNSAGPKQGSVKFCPRLTIYVRSTLQDTTQAKLNRKMWEATPAEQRTDQPCDVDMCDQATALGVCEVELFQLFENAAVNSANGSGRRTWLESSDTTPKRVQVSCTSKSKNLSASPTPSVAVLSIELVCANEGEDVSVREVPGNKEGRIDPGDVSCSIKENPERSPCGPTFSKCVPL